MYFHLSFVLFWLVDSALAARKGRPLVEITEATIESLSFQSLHETTKTLLDQNFHDQWGEREIEKIGQLFRNGRSGLLFF